MSQLKTLSIAAPHGWRNSTRFTDIFLKHLADSFFLFRCFFFICSLLILPSRQGLSPLIDFCCQGSSRFFFFWPFRQVIQRIRQLMDMRSIVAKHCHKRAELD